MAAAVIRSGDEQGQGRRQHGTVHTQTGVSEANRLQEIRRHR